MVTAIESHQDSWRGQEVYDDKHDAIGAAERLAGTLGIPMRLSVVEEGQVQKQLGEFDPEDGWRWFSA